MQRTKTLLINHIDAENLTVEDAYQQMFKANPHVIEDDEMFDLFPEGSELQDKIILEDSLKERLSDFDKLSHEILDILIIHQNLDISKILINMWLTISDYNKKNNASKIQVVKENNYIFFKLRYSDEVIKISCEYEIITKFIILSLDPVSYFLTWNDLQTDFNQDVLLQQFKELFEKLIN